MNNYILIIVLFMAIFIFRAVIKNLSTSKELTISPLDAKKRLDTETGIILLDVRTKNEYLEKHIPNSTLIPLDILSNEAILKLPNKNSEIFVYCKGGNRSAAGVRTLLKLGYTRVHNLGGIVGWPYETVSGHKIK